MGLKRAAMTKPSHFLPLALSNCPLCLPLPLPLHYVDTTGKAGLSMYQVLGLSYSTILLLINISLATNY